MKKLLIILALCLLTACRSEKTIMPVKSTDVMDRMDQKESFLLMVGQTTCGACSAFRPTLLELVKEITVDVLDVELDTEMSLNGDISKPDEVGRQNIKKLMEDYLNGEVTSTPTLVLVKDGKVERLSVGNLTKDELWDWLRVNGVLETEYATD